VNGIQSSDDDNYMAELDEFFDLPSDHEFGQTTTIHGKKLDCKRLNSIRLIISGQHPKFIGCLATTILKTDLTLIHFISNLIN
jgi:hypothetical protein